jgi:ubiquinone/menaquinone biosynthesis C-methylase UbiE
MERVVVHELLDEDGGTRQEVIDSLRDLRMLNRWFGGCATTTALLRRVAHQRGLREITYLDVAGASGDVASAAATSLAKDGIHLTATVLDQAVTHMSAGNGTPALCGSAFELPFRDNAFDVVGCSLFIHHLEPPEIVRFLAEATRCARHAFIINDLRRGRFHWLAAAAGRIIYRSRITRHDATASVSRAYTMPELRQILKDAGYRSSEIKGHYFYRMAAIVWCAHPS